MIEIAVLIIMVASIVIAMRGHRIVKLLEEKERREEQKQKMGNLEPLKP